MMHIVKSVLDTCDDPHEFATAYVNHVTDAKAKGMAPLSVSQAAMAFHSGGLA